jgi:TonB-linked SusC/RagA family outer membrane protein
MFTRQFSQWMGCGAGVALALCLAAPLPAQQGVVIAGKVTSAGGEPLGGATVSVANSNLSAATAADGSYRITLGPNFAVGQQVSVTARYVAHKPVTIVVPLQAAMGEVDFKLPADVFRLEEVVVTGTAGATSAKDLSFSVAKVTSDQMPVPGLSALEGLAGKVAGAEFAPTTAEPGGDVALRLRGSTSISGRQDPLYIVDGVINRFGLADIAPEDIERVEVIKGAAASSLYGSDAANGVVQIFTKRGKDLAEGALRITMRTEAGFNRMPNRMQFSRSHYYCAAPDTGSGAVARGCYVVPTSGPDSGMKVPAPYDPTSGYMLNLKGGRIAKSDGIEDNPYSVYYDSWDALVKTGNWWTGYVSVGQRRGNTNFNASFENTRNQGVIYGVGGYTRQNFRMNLDQQFAANVNGSFSAFYANSTNKRAPEGNDGNNAFFNLMFLDPDVNISKPDKVWGFDCVLPYHEVANQANPLCELRNVKVGTDRTRFTGAGNLRWAIRPWLTAEGNFAYDQESETYSNVVPFGMPGPTTQTTDGSIDKRSLTAYTYNGGATLTADWTSGILHNTTKLGTYLENEINHAFETYDGTLIVRDVPEFTGADPASARPSSGDSTIRNRQYLAVSTFTLKDRYILDGLVREDGSSLFGPQSRWATYFRLSGAWRVTQDVNIPGVDEWKVRASYGTAGLRPHYSDQYQILSVNPGGFTKSILGNPLLKPAHSGELEVGTDIAFGQGRFNLEYNYSRKNTTDQLLLVDLPAVAGFRQQWQNTGALRSHTHELSLGVQVVQSHDANVQLNITGDRSRQVITRWDLPARQYGFGQMPATFFLGRGSDLGAMYGVHYVRDINELYDDPAKAAANTTTWSPDSVMINEDGYVVRKSAYGTAKEGPIPYVKCVATDVSGACKRTTSNVLIGNANPDFNVGFNLSVTIHRFTLTGLLNWQKGGNIYNGTRQWALQAGRDRVQDQAAKPQNDPQCGTMGGTGNGTTLSVGACPRKSSPYYGVSIYNGLSPDDFFVEPGSYAKLKYLSLGYAFSNADLRHIGLGAFDNLRLSFVGRNLFTITKYSGMDPEISGLEGDPFQVRMDWFQYPQYRTFSTVVELAF